MTKLTLKDFLWKPIHTAPLNGKFYELRGDSGYMGTPYRIKVARYEASREQEKDPGYPFDCSAWRDHTGDQLTDDGSFPTHWRMLTTEFDTVSEPEIQAADGSIRKAHYGSGRQPWDDMIDLGWAPHFAAASCLKYVRRYMNKNGDDDIAKARWYYNEMVLRVAKEEGNFAPWSHAFYVLEDQLTQEERILVRTGL